MSLSRFIDKNIRWIFPLPAVLFVFIMIIFPVVYVLYISFTDWNLSSAGGISFIGFKNYLDMFTDKRFTHAFIMTFYFTAAAVAAETILGTSVALVLNKEFKGKNFTKFILLLPMVTTPVAIGLAWTLFYEPTIGLANYVLKSIGLKPLKWLASNYTVIPSLIIVDVWEWTPMITLITLAGLAGLPQDPFEAAIVDGATKFQILRHVTIPLLAPTILIAMTLRSIDALKTFDIIYVMTGGGPGFASETLNIYAYNLSFSYFRFGAASSVLIALFVIVLLFSMIILKLRKKFGL